MEKVLAVI